MSTTEPRPTPWWGMVGLALAVGVAAGLGAVAFRGLISVFHNLLFLGELSYTYDAYHAVLHTPPSPWGVGVILVPVVGAVGVAFLVRTFAPEAKGHGTPEVMDAIWYHNGKIRPVVTVVKAFASALSIGSGGSVGREGPIIQIGAAFGSTVGQVVPMPARQRNVLLAAGAGAGIAGTFGTPLGGILFAVELMMPVVNPATLFLVALSTVTATYVGQYFFGTGPAFDVAALARTEGGMYPLPHFPLFAVFGLIAGAASAVTVRAIYWFEDRFDALPGNYYTRHTLGMLLVGLMFYGLLTWAGHYYIEGVGYATILDVLRGDLTGPGFLFLLCAAKFLATCLTLGSGASGGVFSPSLFLGATLGGGFGALFHYLFPGLGIVPAHFALAGMAAMVGGTTGAVLTAVVMLFEMTRNYTLILPVTLTTVLAGAVRRQLCRPTIYTLKLLRRGHVVPQGLQGWREDQPG